MRTLTIDGSKCQGHGRCALIDADVFDVSDAGLGTVLDPQLAAAHLDTVQKAIDNCPEQAIGWVDG